MKKARAQYGASADATLSRLERYMRIARTAHKEGRHDLSAILQMARCIDVLIRDAAAMAALDEASA